MRYSGILGSYFSKNVRALRIDHDYMPGEPLLERICDALSNSQPNPISWDLTRVAATLNACAQLKEVHIGICYCCKWSWDEDTSSTASQPRYAQWCSYLEHQFAALLADLKDLRGLKTITIRQDYYGRYWLLDENMVEDRTSMEARLLEIEDEVRAEATKPKPKEQKTGQMALSL